MNKITKQRMVIAILFLFFAGSLRFYKLGDWPFAGDETATIAETRSLFVDEDPSGNQNQISRLPRIIPISHVVHHINNSCFGYDEFGSRVVLAFLGTASVGLVFWMMDSLKGRATAIATALLVALWPEHVFQSQETRFYIIVTFFSYIPIFLGAFSAQRQSTSLYVAVCFSIFISLLCHTLMAGLFAVTFAGIMAGAFADRRPFPRNAMLVFLISLLCVGIFYVTYLKPLVSGWNAGENWGYSISHSVLGAVNMVGWPTALLAVLGFLLLLRERNAQNWYWVTFTLCWAAANILLPKILTAFHPKYMSPLAIVIFVLAGCAIGTVYELLRSKNALIAASWIVLACLGSLPSLASHYSDGSRMDMRTAAQYVQKNWKGGDQVSGFSMGLFRHYAKECEPAIPLSSSKTISQLNHLTSGKGRVWLVVQSYRAGINEELRNWLGKHCTHETKVRRRRFDYADYCVDVFLYTPVNNNLNKSDDQPIVIPKSPDN